MPARERTFGMELEVAGNANAIARHLYARGLSLSEEMHGYHCTCTHCTDYFGRPRNWTKVQSDSSCGGEVITSPLQWSWADSPDSGRATLHPWLLMRELERILGPELNVPVDQRCGLHVHVGARDLTDRQLGRLYELVHHYEAVLFRLACGRYERHRGYTNRFTYCRPLSAFDNPMEAMELAKAKSAEVKQSPIARQKYVAANLMPVESLGTVEFRLWESTRSAWRMRFYAQLSVALVERARSRRGPAGQPVYLGQEAPDTMLDLLLNDLGGEVSELVTTRFRAEAWRQWSESPAGWQASERFRPLRHYDADGRLLTAEQAEETAYIIDEHEHTISVGGRPRSGAEAVIRQVPGYEREEPSDESPEATNFAQQTDWRVVAADEAQSYLRQVMAAVSEDAR